ncbi:MAG TPA: hypothetical protein VF977_10315 [Candidatus Binatia bacterium]|jgi:ABC-type transporter Mla subunit MlaD
MVDENENVAAPEQTDENVATAKTGSNLPFIVTLVALTIYFGFQTLQLLSERGNLGLVKSNQDAAIQEAQKVQTQFKTLVTKTGQLADQGHAGAKMVMEELQKRGVGFAPETKPPETKMPGTKAPGKAESKPAK